MIVVTGASKGLGRAICERLLSSGVPVLGLSRDVSNIPFDAMNCDVSSCDDVKKTVQTLKHQDRKICGLINAAGIASMNLAVTTPTTVTEKIVKVNLLGTIYCCQLFSPMIFRNKTGSIINFSSIGVALGLKGESIYVASKAGVEGFTRAFAREMADFNVNVNCIAPGPIDTDLLNGVSPALISKVVAQQIFQKQFTPEAVCDVVEMLLDPKSKSLSGQVLYVGGV
jgi:3-oxoacyl-[acyl-carrier protein] reductase